MKKIRVGILFGGQSAEHEVSIQSAKNVYQALDKTKYDPVLIGIDRKGGWHALQNAKVLAEADMSRKTDITRNTTAITIVPTQTHNQIIATETGKALGSVDVVFPVLHGPMGEDGTVQGLLKLLNIPFVGPDVLGSAVGMDKDVMKRLLRDANIPITPFLVFQDSDRDKISYQMVSKKLGKTVFIKPANLGSSVGVSKATNKIEFDRAVKEAFAFDTKILVEAAVIGREIECSVLGNNPFIASVPGEVIPTHEFYSYEAKYLDENGAALEIPAKLSKSLIQKVQQTAIKACEVLCVSGMSRVDCFLTNTGDVLINEINTIPGFTKISMYPKLWEASGIGYTDLISRLLSLAIDYHQKRSSLKTTR